MARRIKDGSYTQWYRHNIDRWQGSAEINALSCEGYRAFHNLVMYQFQRPDRLLPDDERTLAFARSPAGNRGNLTPHPATWFNQGRYDDNPTEWEQIGDGTNQQRSGF